MKFLFVTILSFTLLACSNHDDATRALRAQGFTDIEVLGYSAFACSKDDFYSTKFRAKNAQGMVVTGTVCSGLLFKNATIRY